MNLEGAINFSENDVSSIYTMNSSNAGQYCIIVPKNPDGVLSMLVDLSKKDLFDSLADGTGSKDEVLKGINEEYSKLRESYSSAMLIFPMMAKSELDNAVTNNDKQKMFDETKKIAAFTSDVYKKVIDSGIDKAKISQKIIVVETDDADSKFVTWLKEQQPNFVDGIKFNKPDEAVIPNNVVSNDIFASNNVEEQDTSVTEVKEPETVEEPVAVVNDVAEPVPVFPEASESIAPVEGPEVTDNGNATSDIMEPVSDAPEVNAEQPVVPQPIENVSLNIESQPEQNTVPETNDTANEVVVDKKSGGFVNLLILLVILVVVTVVSIELGKFLFNTFNA